MLMPGAEIARDLDHAPEAEQIRQARPDQHADAKRTEHSVRIMRVIGVRRCRRARAALALGVDAGAGATASVGGGAPPAQASLFERAAVALGSVRVTARRRRCPCSVQRWARARREARSVSAHPVEPASRAPERVGQTVAARRAEPTELRLEPAGSALPACLAPRCFGPRARMLRRRPTTKRLAHSRFWLDAHDLCGGTSAKL